MDIKHDEPKISVNVHRRTTQLNMWIIVAVLVFFAAGVFIVWRQFRDPADTVEEGRTTSQLQSQTAERSV